MSAHALPEGIGLSRVEVRRPQLFSEVTGVTINVPLLPCLCPLVSNGQIHEEHIVPLFAFTSDP